MTTLIISRDGLALRRVRLGDGTLRIGRGDQNEILLPDPTKAVSRFHAELRFEDGRYTLVDLNSQNGTWIGGRQIHQEVLEPGVAVALGPYSLVLELEDVPDLAPASTASEAVETVTARTSPSVAADLDEDFEAARAALVKGDFPAAITGFEEILRANPRYPNAAELLVLARGASRAAAELAVEIGRKAEAGGDPETARLLFARALELDPDSSAAAQAADRLQVRGSGTR